MSSSRATPSQSLNEDHGIVETNYSIYRYMTIAELEGESEPESEPSQSPVRVSSTSKVFWPPVIWDKMVPPSPFVADEEEPWAPQWKPVEESPQFDLGLLQPFLREWDLEKFQHVDDSEFPATVQVNGVTYEPKDEHNKLKAFLKLVRESRGYDFDGIFKVPMSVVHISRFCGYPADMVKEEDREFEWWTSDAKFVVQQINVEAEKHCNKRYEFHKLEKWVEVMLDWCTLMTFSVKEVHANVFKTVQAMAYTPIHMESQILEWRFKPQPKPNLS